MQTDQRFRQNEAYKLNKKYNVDIFQSSTNSEKAFADKEIITKLKKLPFKSQKVPKLKANV